MIAVFDASVVANWFLDTLHHEPAISAARSYETRLAPELLLAEVANAFWLNVRAERISNIHARRSLRQTCRVITRFAPLANLAERAVSLASDLKHPAYDCFYIALAQHEGVPLVTIDKRLASAAKCLPDFRLELIGDRV